MSFERDQDEFSLPAGKFQDRRSSNFLPKYYRTDTNKKFLNGSIDQMLTPGTIEKIDAFAGRRFSKTTKKSDSYLSDVSQDREYYQFEPSVVYKDDLENVEFLKDYNDYLGSIRKFKGSTSNHSIMNGQEFYVWDPHIDWDKFSNFREYYWMPFGPNPIPVSGQSKDIISTFTVTLANDLGSLSYVFSPDGTTRNPSITLFRGQTYRFVVDTPGQPFAIASLRTFSDNDPTLGVSITQNSVLYKEGIISPSDYVEQGVIEFIVPENAPTTLFYISENDVNISGTFTVLDITENTEIDVESEILGKKLYKTSNGIELSNGMKLFFRGKVTPEKYQVGNWYVEGVGSAIQLVSEKDLEIPAIFTSDVQVPFDSSGWDTLPFDDATSFAGEKDYIVINRASADRNPWSRYNRWFHKDVIEKSAKINNRPANLNQDLRARRPIIEFERGLQLFNHGSRFKQNVDLIDNHTTDVFSIIEGTIGFHIDGVLLTEGMRVLFTADLDPLVNGKIYRVKFINHLGRRQITLIETSDSNPQENETVLILNGVINRGKMFYYDGLQWKPSQEKTRVNQPPMFDLFDKNGNSFSDRIEYPETTFRGNKIFSYRLGFGPDDPELGFSIAYRNIANNGDIVFDFNLLTDYFQYQVSNQEDKKKRTDLGYIKQYDYQGIEFEYVNAWTKANKLSRQAVIRQFFVEDRDTFLVDVFDNSAVLDDLEVVVFLNSQRQRAGIDFRFENINDFRAIIFNKTLKSDDSVLLKCYSSADKNANGFYEIPHNLERNPLNENIESFTFGEVNDHVDSIVENLEDFEGTFPGRTNLRDLGKISKFGRKFVQHTGPLNLALFHLTDKSANVIKALKYARREYSLFKRRFITESESLDLIGSPREQVDEILRRINRDKVTTQAFYFSDMVGSFGAVKNTVIAPTDGPRFLPLTNNFTLDELSNQAVYIYVNDQILVHTFDYVIENGFVKVTKSLSVGDVIDIYEFESTNGSFIPPTPSKLGLYPSFEPLIYVDNSYIEPRTMIQGHDGSLMVAFGDYRDEIILELERRIFNNIKSKNKNNFLNIFDFVGGKYRNTGIKKELIDNIMLSDFIQWTDQAGSPDFTDFSFWDQDNPFTYNYSTMSDADGRQLKGFWRNVYRDFYDTDRPHLCPWEMLGFAIKPSWWEEVYGPAPYTKNNSILWNDLEAGIVREPGKNLVRNLKFSRPKLLNHIPVDDRGRLVDPISSNLAKGFVLTKTRRSFEFGDLAPTETAWRRSSDYPFSLITAWTLLQPAKIFGLAFDISRIEKDLTGGLVYSDTQKRIQTKDLVFPCICSLDKLKTTSGLVNYISDYIANSRFDQSNNQTYQKYQKVLTGLDCQLAIKIGGFADKEKLKLILDSRTPLNKGNVFVPEKNYQIVFNVSSPLDEAIFSGIIIERAETGFIIRGYDKENPVFSYNDFTLRSSDPGITAGGISESFVRWSSGQEYVIGSVVQHQNLFFRTKITHRSGNSFDNDKFIQLPELPIIGGASAIIRTQFTNEVKRLPYGSLLTSIQDVVDFLVGYDVYLRLQGFKFNFFNKQTETLEDMQLCIKEFLFWTTQNWDIGTVLTLSPVANRIDFERENFVVDNIYDPFYDYNLIAGDGSRITREFSNIFRDKENQFSITPVEIQEGIYFAKLPLVQKEHVILVDNITEFNDVIYDKVPGYRQERVRVAGYRTANWTGGLNIPGFFYDKAHLTLWQPWRDYAIGDLVKYKEFFYSSNKKHTSSDSFDANKWTLLRDRPESKLFPNWDYRANQFADFYELESDNFDKDQQRLAQHLIGYQKREYLSNIIVDDVSQYKFYQGFIREKGTLYSLTKLFDALSNTNQDSLEFYEEWAVRLGQYGAISNIQEIEYHLDERKLRMEPQPIELTESIDNTRLDLIYEISENDTYLKPEGYNHRPFKELNDTEVFARDSGYVRDTDVDIIVDKLDDILELNIFDTPVGKNLWILDISNNWVVYRHARTDLKVIGLQDNVNEFTLVFEKLFDLSEGDIIGINTFDEIMQGFYKVKSISFNSATFEKRQPPTAFNEINDSSIIAISKMISRRFTDSTEINKRFNNLRSDFDERVWLDNFEDGRWAVLDNRNIFSVHQELNSDEGDLPSFSEAYDVNEFNTLLAVGYPGSHRLSQDGFGSVNIYIRSNENGQWEQTQTLVLRPESQSKDFGSFIAVSPNGSHIAVSDLGNKKVYIFERTQRGIYRLPLSGSVITINEEGFGTRLLFRGNARDLRLFIGSPKIDLGKIYVYKLDQENWVQATRINDLNSVKHIGDYFDINKHGDVLVTSSLIKFDDNTLPLQDNGSTVSINTFDQCDLLIYRKDSNDDEWSLDQIVERVDSTAFDLFGNSFAINDQGDKIAVGAPGNDDEGLDNGCVYIYDQNDGSFEMSQIIRSPELDFNEMFGDFVNFSRNKLIISSRNGDLKFTIFFDENETTFDNNLTRILDEEKDVGKVYVYQNLNNSYIYGEDLNKADLSNFVHVDSSGSFPLVDKIRFRSVNNLRFENNHIYLGLPESMNFNGSRGVLIDCRADLNKDSWTVRAKQQGRIDVNQFKRCFIYSKSQNKILSDLDIIDPRQGKIAAPAEQELSFKTFYDPAIYSNNINNEQGVVIDRENAWSKENVGKLWWNLSTSSWYNPYQSGTLYRSSKWNELVPNSTVQICEWVETDLLPGEWRTIADTSEGFARGVSGQPLYESEVYTERRFFDEVNNRFVSKYYYWVVNTAIVPIHPWRLRSALEVSQLIASPESIGYRFLSPLSDKSFAIHNTKGLIEGTDSILHFTLINDVANRNNIHSEHQLITEGLSSSIPNRDIEQKWIDSLVGYDSKGRKVPDDRLSVKEKYGILNFPRQGMFVNRLEAVKQFVERANSVLISQQITDSFDISRFELKDQIPDSKTNLYDEEVSLRDDLRFVSVARIKQAIVEPVIVNGRVTSVNIIDSGRGYRVPPTFIIRTKTGSGARLRTEIDSVGKITKVVVQKSGSNYSLTDSIEIRKFSVLIRNDETLRGKWSIVEWDTQTRSYNIVLTQSFDTTQYWDLVDWYADGFTDQTRINFTIDQSFEIFGLRDSIGDIVKIRSTGSTSEWLLLKKIDNQQTNDFLTNYQIIGKQNGTIQLKDLLFTYNVEYTGYDVSLYDIRPYDSEPVIELRNIIQALKEDIFIGELAVEWNNLFFASVRYLMSEQLFVDWIFKTSFVSAVHNLGDLSQKVTFQNDNLSNYEDYVNEVKPYSTKIREFISDYSTTDTTRSLITDFDLPPSFDSVSQQIEVSGATYENGEIIGIIPRHQNYPFGNWIENLGFELVEIKVTDPGSGYMQTPSVIISGNSGATARAFVSKGSINSIQIINPGSMLLYKPEIIIEGPIREDGRSASAIAVLGNSLVRTPSVTLKFDRISTTGIFETLESIEEFEGTGARRIFNLKWPIDTNTTRFRVLIDGIAQLTSEVTVSNRVDNSKGFSREIGVLTFREDPPAGSLIRIEYNKNVGLLTAVDRINFFYTPNEGMPGKELAQLMSGTEYSGVIIDTFGFGTDQGWDISGWGGQWDTFNLDDEGNFIPSNQNFDVALSGGTPTKINEDGTGGDFDVLSATGISAGEIIIDGDEFVTPATSAGPEELVPGQLGDVLDIRMYQIQTEGVGVIEIISYILDGETEEFELIDFPIDSDNILVKIDGIIIERNEYTVDPKKQLIKMKNSGIRGQRLTIISMGVNGSSLIDFGSTDSDGSMSVQTDIKWQEIYFSLITINGNVVDRSLYSIDNNDGRFEIQFVDAPKIGELIQYAFYDSEVQSFSQIIADNTFDNSSGQNIYHKFDTKYIPVPFNKQPISHNILVKVDNRLLSPGYSVRYQASDAREYAIERWQFDSQYEIKKSEIMVFVNGELINESDFFFDTSKFSIVFTRSEIADPGSEIEIYILKNSEYFTFSTKIIIDKDLRGSISAKDKILVISDDNQEFEFTVVEITQDYLIVERFDRNLIELKLNSSKFTFNGIPANILDVTYVLGEGITFVEPPQDFEKVTIYQFSNHDINDFSRKEYEVVSRVRIDPTTPDYFKRNFLSAGIFDLKYPSINANYVWIIKNGKLLTSGVDYILENQTRICLLQRPEENDKFDFLQFRNTDSVIPRFGYRQFKDILGRTHFKRLNQENSYVLAEDLKYYDVSIKLDSTTGIERPNRKKNIPGVLFIDGERIEYFQIKGNTLLQLRRGTLGTSIKETHAAGTRAFGQGARETIRYRDEVITKTSNSSLIKVFKNDDIILNSDNSLELPDYSAAGFKFASIEITGLFTNTDGIQVRRIARVPYEVFVTEENNIAVRFFEDLPMLPEIKIMLTTKWIDPGFSIAQSLINYSTVNSIMEIQPVDLFDVFISGQRLRKNTLTQFTPSIDQDSPEADTKIEADFEVDLETNKIILRDFPPEDTRIEVVRKIGKTWNESSKRLSLSRNQISNFLRNATIDIPK